MGEDSFQEVSYNSWFSRLGSSIGGVIGGLLLFVVSFPMLFLNEGCAVRTAQSLAEGEKAVVSVPADRVDPANEGKLVHVSGETVPQKEISDTQFGVAVNGISLQRYVEIYQWKEEKQEKREKQVGGGEKVITTYSYKEDWVRDPIDSSKFKDQTGHRNQGTLPVQSQTWNAEVKLGAFELTPKQVNSIGGAQSLPVTSEMQSKLSDDLRNQWQVQDSKFYKSYDPGSGGGPRIGDVRVSYKWVRPGPVSVVARQFKNTFEPYHAKAGDAVDLLQIGSVSAEQMFAAAQSANTTRTWIIRLVGFVMMGIGICMVFQPIVVFADFLPFLGNLVGLGVGVFAFGTAFVLSLITIALGWIVYRPLLGASLLVLAIGSLVGLIYLGRKKKQTLATQVSAAAS